MTGRKPPQTLRQRCAPTASARRRVLTPCRLFD